MYIQDIGPEGGLYRERIQSMEKAYTAIGDFYNEEGAQLIDVPADEEAIYEKVEEIMKRNPMGSVLSDEDVAVLRAYLPAIGCDEASRSDEGSLQGKGLVTKSAEGCGVSIDAKGDLQVESRWNAERKQWMGDMHVTRTGGEAEVKELRFDFYFLSIGMGSAGKFIVLYNEQYTRRFNDPFHLSDFNGGGTAQASRMDISKHIQWGFYMHAKCSVLTAEGTLVI